MKIFLKNYKFGILVFLLISIFVTYFVYKNEDKNIHYSSKINLPNIEADFKSIFKSFLSTNSFIENDEADIACNVSYEDENGGTHLLISIKTLKDIKQEPELSNKIKIKCKRIIIKTLNQYIGFKNEVNDFYERTLNDNAQYNSFVFQKKMEIIYTVFFLEYLRNKIDSSTIDLTKDYEPSTFKEHFINLTYTVLIALSLFIGFAIAKSNLKVKKRRKKIKR